MEDNVELDTRVGTQLDNTDSTSGVIGTATSEKSNDKPSVGMEFSTDTEAYNFYNSYALMMGFGIRKTSCSYSRKKDEAHIVIGRTFVCDKEGKKNYVGMEERTSRGDTKVGCGARMRITLTTRNTWKISVFVEAHSGHELTSPNKAMKHRSHMVLHRSQYATDLMDRLRDQGLPPSTISKVLNVRSGRSEDVITPQHCQTHLRKGRNNNIGNECGAIIDQFAKKKLLDPDFYFSWEVDENRFMRSVFWADGHSRSSYLQFGDVLVFDVTYRTNKLCLPFAPFTGVNHHRQSILFGCALLADEEEDTFVWLFSEWLKCMHGQPPVSIITDQDIAMGNAIRRVFPTSRHRFCSWHIGKHYMEHLPKLQSLYGDDIGVYVNRWRHSTTIEQAEKHWGELKEKFDVDEDGNTWLPMMYRKRHHWIEAYLNDSFWAGMKSTQRSESINAFFDGYVNSQTRLHEFVSCYDRTSEQRRSAELHEDFLSLNSKPPIISSHPIEVQASNLYTRSMFKLFQDEMKGVYQLIRTEESKDERTTVYNFISISGNSSRRLQVVYEDGESASASCTCALFETVGLLCKHILNVMCNVHQLQIIPKRYILPRWKIDARHRSITDLMQGRNNACNEGSILEAWAARAEFNEAWQMSLGSSELLIELRAMLSAFVSRHELVSRQRCHLSLVESNSMSVQDLSAHISIRDPHSSAVTKGRPKGATRLKSGIEQGIDKAKKKQRTCQNCFQKGHYRTSCKNAPARLSARIQESDDEEDDEDESDK